MRDQLKFLVKVSALTWSKANARDIGLAAAGVAYFGLLSLAPALAAIVSLYGLVGDPETVREQVGAMRSIAPPDVTAILNEQLARLVETDTGLLAWSGILALILSIWSANRSVDGFLRALAGVGGGARQRGLVQQTVVSLGFTLGAIGVALIALAAVAVMPWVLALLRLDETQDVMVRAARWPILLSAVVVFVAAVYRWGPNRPPPRWRAIWPTAALATAVWVAGSAGLSLWATTFEDGSAAYGSLAGAAGLLLWLFLSAFIFLLGGVAADTAEAA